MRYYLIQLIDLSIHSNLPLWQVYDRVGLHHWKKIFTQSVGTVARELIPFLDL